MQELIQAVHGIAPGIRYVAVYRNGTLTSSVKNGLAGASSSESDRYEELIVNPTLLTLVTQRGDIDCGGARFALIRYGNFFEYVAPIPGGHISVGIDSDVDALAVADRIRWTVGDAMLSSAASGGFGTLREMSVTADA